MMSLTFFIEVLNMKKFIVLFLVLFVLCAGLYAKSIFLVEGAFTRDWIFITTLYDDPSEEELEEFLEEEYPESEGFIITSYTEDPDFANLIVSNYLPQRFVMSKSDGLPTFSVNESYGGNIMIVVFGYITEDTIDFVFNGKGYSIEYM